MSEALLLPGSGTVLLAEWSTDQGSRSGAESDDAARTGTAPTRTEGKNYTKTSQKDV